LGLYSGFDNSTEDWSVGSFFARSSEKAQDFQATGGWSGGYLQTTDKFGNNAFRAPSWWLGDQSRLFGSVLRFYQKAAETDGLTAPVVVLASETLRLQYRAAPPRTDWTEYRVALRAGQWEIGDGSGGVGKRLATNEEIFEALSNVEWLAFNGDWHTGEDLVGLDEVSLYTPDNSDFTEIPEPAAMTMFAGFGALAVALARSRMSRAS
jgi:hypothetical protein